MKTLLFNPIFINPQAYFVFPNINGSLVQETEVSVEPVMFAGTIEVKVIANGDTSLIRYYKNVSNIDLIEFENSWVRISLYNQLGAVVLGEWKLQISNPTPPEVDYIYLIKNSTLVSNKTLIKNE